MSSLIHLIISPEKSERDIPLENAIAGFSPEQLQSECEALDAFRRKSENLYEKVRALFFLFAIHRFHLPKHYTSKQAGLLSFEANERILKRRFEEGIDVLLEQQNTEGSNDTLSSALAYAYYHLALQYLANQVRRSVRSVKGNQWMFRMGHPSSHPLRIRNELLERANASTPYPVIHETTPVRMDLTHSGWSDIFFLGMDLPEAARVLNISVDLAVWGRDKETLPPVQGFFRVIDKPVIQLISLDLKASAEITNLEDLFSFGKDYLGLLKAAVIAAGIVPPGIEGSGQSLESLLERLLGPGKGFELVSHVRDIPKGSRLAVSTNLLACLISACMRATGQTSKLEGSLNEAERRIVAARAILGEWLGGSGGGWQDSGGVWPGIKTICGELATENDPEYGISRGCLLPRHRVLNEDISADTVQGLQDSLVLVHGGMAQNVGPILEMVSEKYLLRSGKEWESRALAIELFDNIVDCLKTGDIKRLAALTTQNFFEPVQSIIPWATTYYTEQLIQKISARFGDKYWGFVMLGGMSGGGMGFFVDPSIKSEALPEIRKIMLETKGQLEQSLPFAMDPVVYEFTINPNGTFGTLLSGEKALLPPVYYKQVIPELVRSDIKNMTAGRVAELQTFTRHCEGDTQFQQAIPDFFRQLLPDTCSAKKTTSNLDDLLVENGFDTIQHDTIRQQLQNGRIGLAQNRFPTTTTIEDVEPEDTFDGTGVIDKSIQTIGESAIRKGEVGVVTLAAGVGSRWTEGAGVVKGLHPFCKLGGKHRSFIETHLAKSKKVGDTFGAYPLHVITSSYLTHQPIKSVLEQEDQYGYPGSLFVSKGKYIGLRMVPMVRDLRFSWEEVTEQILDERAQKMKESVRDALAGWARGLGEGSDYRDNLPMQCLHPVGHWYEIPNLLRNGTLAAMLKERPQLKYLMLHNIDTLGASIDPAFLGVHIESKKDFSFEVITRRYEDRGGGLARINGKPRLVEGLSLPSEEEEYKLSYYNSMTTWISIERLLALFELSVSDLDDEAKVADCVRKVANRMPTYITIKEVKKRWGHAQEDIYPVSQFEKLWSDMTAYPGAECGFITVPRNRGQQLKAQAQLDGWLRDGSAQYLDSICAWT
ncbi:MAG: UTP--glucose-1-phosphate uridylyltransferase [Opitutales bacterium]